MDLRRKAPDPSHLTPRAQLVSRRHGRMPGVSSNTESTEAIHDLHTIVLKLFPDIFSAINISRTDAMKNGGHDIHLVLRRGPG